MDKKLKPHEILADENNITCICPDTNCLWHGHCRDCVALHRYHATIPSCLEIEIKNKKDINIDHINAVFKNRIKEGITMRFYNPYKGLNNPNANWQKTNFHIHAGVEKDDLCGIHPIADVVKAYEDAGYNAIAITNHDLYVPHNIESEMELIDGVEYSMDFHTLLIGHNRDDFPNMGHQEIIDYTLEQGGIAVLAHPSYRGHDYWKNEYMDSLKGYVGIEVVRAPKRNPAAYNGENGFSVEKWDWLLSRGHRVYGLGNDDLHYIEHVDGGFTMIYAKSAKFDDLKEAINAGCFYASTGVELESYNLDENTIKAKAKPKQSADFTYRFIGAGGKLLKQSIGAEAEYTITTPEKYVRVEVISSENEAMFLQPVFLED